ncbi:MAG TPA: YqgE/AlgH family protein [Burkholderiales bacterium]|nr:YqgE/AlgH family protein [Burkholderiales bacterium]
MHAPALRRPHLLVLWLSALALWLGAMPARSVETVAPAVFLVAKENLLDPNFAHSVVLVVFPKDAGPVGVILNRPVPLTLKEVFPGEPRLKDRGDKLYFGGPVRLNGLMFLCRRPTAPDNAFPVVGDLYLSGDGGLLDEMLAGPDAQVQRYFLGYSGWAPDQLEFEIAQGGWYVLPADLDTVVKGDPKTLWRDLLLRATAVKT